MRRRFTFDDSDNGCFGCSPTNQRGLGIEFYETDDGVEIEYVASEELCGAQGIVHGGIQATLLDEVMCVTALAKLGHTVVTGELTIRYLAPVPTGTPILGRGRIRELRGRSAFIDGTLWLAGDEQERTRAQGRFFRHDDEG